MLRDSLHLQAHQSGRQRAPKARQIVRVGGIVRGHLVDHKPNPRKKTRSVQPFIIAGMPHQKSGKTKHIASARIIRACSKATSAETSSLASALVQSGLNPSAWRSASSHVCPADCAPFMNSAAQAALKEEGFGWSKTVKICIKKLQNISINHDPRAGNSNSRVIMRDVYGCSSMLEVKGMVVTVVSYLLSVKFFCILSNRAGGHIFSCCSFRFNLWGPAHPSS